ncbi:DUF2922 domain-containing protein [Bacillus chungangensis]|uniref:DUF2922 domain-containing protein n=1 Tax=Bacillus chungangensis TaxID=587633 RepID=A0ABT9WYY7_9BACI|nr:DUF2922 domain-containing protein [Bacillus chungangensis]MDQ0178506.1 hypothetical protein [Bacillus chungangensis]
MKVLELIFNTDDGKTARLAIENPVEPVDVEKVKSSMETIIHNNVFTMSSGAAYSSVKGARLVERRVTELTVG